jgi:hypothetical protein
MRRARQSKVLVGMYVGIPIFPRNKALSLQEKKFGLWTYQASEVSKTTVSSIL